MNFKLEGRVGWMVRVLEGRVNWMDLILEGRFGLGRLDGSTN